MIHQQAPEMLSDYAGHIIYSPCLSEKRNKKNAGDSPLVRNYSFFFIFYFLFFYFYFLFFYFFYGKKQQRKVLMLRKIKQKNKLQ